MGKAKMLGIWNARPKKGQAELRQKPFAQRELERERTTRGVKEPLEREEPSVEAITINGKTKLLLHEQRESGEVFYRKYFI